MAADFGLLGALSGRDNWQAKENERRAALTYTAASNALKEQKINENEKVQKTMSDYYNTVNNLKVLPKGMERIKELSDKLKPEIAESIKKSGGDLEKWFKSHGSVDLDKYLSTVMTHPTTQRELMNATHAAQYQADQQAGLQERTNFDANGTPINTFADQMRKYDNGDTDTLGYNGAFKAGKFDEKFFGQTYGDLNRYKAKPVSLEDYAATSERELIAQGMSPQDARQQAMGLAYNYKRHLDSKGTPLQWKSDKYTAQEQLAAYKLKKLQSGGGMDGGISYLAGIQNDLIQPDKSTADRRSRLYLPATDDLHSIIRATGQEVDEKTGGIKNVGNITSRGPVYSSDFSTPLDFSGLNDKDLVMTGTAIVHKDGKNYIQYHVQANDAGLRETMVDGKQAKTKWYDPFHTDKSIPGQRTKGGNTDFDVFQEIPINASTIAQQSLNAKEASKTGQFAMGMGMQQQHVDELINTLQDMDAEE